MTTMKHTEGVPAAPGEGAGTARLVARGASGAVTTILDNIPA